MSDTFMLTPVFCQIPADTTSGLLAEGRGQHEFDHDRLRKPVMRSMQVDSADRSNRLLNAGLFSSFVGAVWKDVILTYLSKPFIGC